MTASPDRPNPPSTPAPPPRRWWERGVFRSAVNRLIVAHFGLIAAATAVVMAYVFASTTGLIQAQVREIVTAEIRGFEDDHRLRGVFGIAESINRRSANESDAVYLLTDRRGRRIAGNLRGWPPPVVPGQGWVVLRLTRTDRREPSLVEALSLRLEGGERLLVGRDAEARRLFDQTLFRAVILAVAVLAVLTLVVGYLLSRLLRGRLEMVAGTAAEIMSGDLDRRVPRSGAGDEFDQLAERLNAMLDRIAALVGDLRMVTDSVSHDLRSPLTRLRGHLEGALTAGDDVEARDCIEKALAETDVALSAFTGLIAIARVEAGVGRDQFEAIDLSGFVFEMAELYEPAAEAAGLRLSASAASGLRTTGHRQLLAQAVSNLIENALRHAPPGSAIGLSAERAAEDPDRLALIRVTDQGPGIPPEQRARAVRRFVQLDPSRGGDGAGLGLALAEAVARLHGGALRLADAAPGETPPGLSATLALRSMRPEA